MNGTLTINYSDGSEDDDIFVAIGTWDTLGEAIKEKLDEYRGNRYITSFLFSVALL